MLNLAPSARIQRTLFASVAAIVLLASFVGASVPTASAQVGPALTVPLAAGTSFNSSFNSNHNGWTPVSGTWTLKNSAYYSSVGVEGEWSTTKHSGTYRNFVYSVKMKRSGSDPLNQQGLFVRGIPTPFSVAKFWHTAYTFTYANDTGITVLRWLDGLVAPLEGTFTAAVHPGGWNTLKVVAYNSLLAFYVNGTLIWSGSDPNISSGSVGLGMYRGPLTTGNRLLVDWAKLQVITLDMDPFTSGGMLH